MFNEIQPCTTQSGMYFITIYCNQRQCLFGNIINGVMQLNKNENKCHCKLNY